MGSTLHMAGCQQAPNTAMWLLQQHISEDIKFLVIFYFIFQNKKNKFLR